MSLPTQAILGILTDNLNFRRSVMPLNKKRATEWSNDLGLPKKGPVIIYTGLMYQMSPAIRSLASQMAGFENSFITKFMGIGRLVNKFINITPFMLRVSKKLQQKYNGYIRNIANALTKSGIDYGYLYEEELYAGALIYDQGVIESTKKHLQKIIDLFEKYSIKEVITIDPHTTEMLSDVIPKYFPEFKIKVTSYLKKLVENDYTPISSVSEKVVLHDSCLYARGQRLFSEPRELLRKSGREVIDIEESEEQTYCCGGPAESLFPSKSEKMAEKRIEQLKSSGCGTIVTACPLCHLNLSKDNDMKVEDISDYLG